MIDMGMAEDDGIDVFGPKGELPIAAMAFGPATLKEPTIEQQRFAACIHLVHRPGNRLGSTPEGNGGVVRRLQFFCHERILRQRCSGSR